MISFGNTAEERIDLSFLPEVHNELWIKRDDLLHPFISGNKWRKLEGIIRFASQNGVEHIKTFGGAFSNHLLATACAGASFGLKTTGVVRGEAVNNHVLNLCRQFGMELEFISREEMRNLRLQQDKLELRGTSLTVPEGGNCPEAWSGCMKIVRENTQNYDEVWLAVGTGTTLTGIGQAMDHGRINGVMVLKDASLVQQLQDKGFNIHSGFERGGYAKADKDLLASMSVFAAHTGILLDPVYTGKLWMALKERLKIGSGKKILMIHTGGLSGWFSDRILDISSS